MTGVPIVSWNVQGLSDPQKRSMVAAGLSRHHPAIYGLQETHLTRDTLSWVQYAWAGWSYHSTHSYSRGVCVLIHRSLVFNEIDVLVIREGRYVFVPCQLFTMQCIIALVYIPPPFSREVLQILLAYLLDKPDVPLLLMGDFNCYLHPHLDKHPSINTGSSDRGTLKIFTKGRLD